MKRLLLVFLHGFGDNIMATPSVKALARHYIVDIVVLGYNNSKTVWENNEYVNGIYEIYVKHPTYWNPFIYFLIDRYKVRNSLKKIVNLKSYDKIINSVIYPVPHFLLDIPFCNKFSANKIKRIADELNVCLDSDKTMFNCGRNGELEAKLFLDNASIKNGYIIVHALTTESARDFNPHVYNEFVDSFKLNNPNISIVLIGDNKTCEYEAQRNYKYLNSYKSYSLGNSLSIYATTWLIKNSLCFVGIDSGPLHIALAQNSLPIVALFNLKRIKFEDRVPTNSNLLIGFNNGEYNASDINRAVTLLLNSK